MLNVGQVIGCQGCGWLDKKSAFQYRDIWVRCGSYVGGGLFLTWYIHLEFPHLFFGLCTGLAHHPTPWHWVSWAGNVKPKHHSKTPKVLRINLLWTPRGVWISVRGLVRVRVCTYIIPHLNITQLQITRANLSPLYMWCFLYLYSCYLRRLGGV